MLSYSAVNFSVFYFLLFPHVLSINDTCCWLVVGNELERALRKIGREDVIRKCMYNIEEVTDEVERAVAKVHIDQAGKCRNASLLCLVVSLLSLDIGTCFWHLVDFFINIL